MRPGSQPSPDRLHRGRPVYTPARYPLALRLRRACLLRLQGVGFRRRRLHGEHLPEHLQTGEQGELEACLFLRRLGYGILHRRWRDTDLPGDLDLVAMDGATLCFIEVKTRTTRGLAPAELAVDAAKSRTLRALAASFRRTLPPALRTDVPYRFDTVSVYLLPSGTECELLRSSSAGE